MAGATCSVQLWLLHVHVVVLKPQLLHICGSQARYAVIHAQINAQAGK